MELYPNFSGVYMKLLKIHLYSSKEVNFYYTFSIVVNVTGQMFLGLLCFCSKTLFVDVDGGLVWGRRKLSKRELFWLFFLTP